MSRSSTDRTFVVVNERPVHVKELVKVLRQYYTNCHACEGPRHPVCYVYVKLPAADVDVNVDPNKTTVFLQHMTEVRVCLEEILVEVYGPLENVPSWHYSEATTKTKEGITRERDKSQGSKMSLTKALDSQEKTTNLASLSNLTEPPSLSEATESTRQEILTTADRNTTDSTPLPSFSLTFHQAGHSMEATQANNNNNNNNLPDDMEMCADVHLGDVTNDTKSHPNSTETPCESSESDVQQNSSSVLSEECLKDLGKDNGEAIQMESDSVIARQVVEVNAETLQQNDSAAASTSSSVNDSLLKDSVNDEGESDQRLVSGSDWSKGRCIKDNLGNPVQPVQLLPPNAQNAPGKRLSSPASENASQCPAKRSRVSMDELPANQTTLLDLLPTSDFELFCAHKWPEFEDSSPDLSQQEINDQLKTEWESLSNEERIKYRDKCWQHKKRTEKVADKPGDKQSTKSAKPQKVDIRAQVAALACQSQEEKQQRQLRRRLYHCERSVTCDLTVLRAAVESPEAQADRSYFAKPTVIGQAKSCDAWFCCYDNALYLVNVHRLSEVTLYKKLREKHKLPAKSCDKPVEMNKRQLTEGQWSALEGLAASWNTGDIYFRIKDERLTANGFDILCHTDADQNLQAELVGLCDLVPAYSIQDLVEVLEAISNNSSVSLADARSTKALYYLQGEAARMVQQNVGQKLVADVQTMVDQITEAFSSVCCIHHKPVFHSLFDLSTVLPLLCLWDAQDSV